MATCRSCGTRNSTMTLAPTGELVTAPVGSFSLAGAVPKFPAKQRYRLACDPELGGCGWSVTGVVDGGDLVADGGEDEDEEESRRAWEADGMFGADPDPDYGKDIDGMFGDD